VACERQAMAYERQAMAYERQAVACERQAMAYERQAYAAHAPRDGQEARTNTGTFLLLCVVHRIFPIRLGLVEDLLDRPLIDISGDVQADRIAGAATEEGSATL
jgi:hypothetical protein